MPDALPMQNDLKQGDT